MITRDEAIQIGIQWAIANGKTINGNGIKPFFKSKHYQRYADEEIYNQPNKLIIAELDLFVSITTATGTLVPFSCGIGSYNNPDTGMNYAPCFPRLSSDTVRNYYTHNIVMFNTYHLAITDGVFPDITMIGWEIDFI